MSVWQDGTLHQTWSPVGVQPQVDTYGARNTAHVFGTVALGNGDFFWSFAPVFNGATFFAFVKAVVAHFLGRKVFMILDNGSGHNLSAEGKAWLAENGDKISLHRLPPYSPQFNAIEGVWKVTRKMTTHNRFYRTADERDAALTATFTAFQQGPKLIAAQTARFV